MPFYNRFEIYRRMQLERNHFNVNLGDTIYSDTEVAPGIPLARTVAQKWGKYRQNLALPNLQNLRNSGTLYSHWDDHEFINDFSKAEHGLAIYASGVKAFRDYQPVTYSGINGLYRSFRWGRNLEVFFLDERSFRSAKASAGGTCNASTGEPDLAPTAPQSSRNLFGVLAPSLNDPPPPGCVARINDPSRTMLGARQYAAFTGAVSRSTARFKVVMNETPIQQFYALPYDRWEGYETERRRLITFLRTRVKNVLFLTTDTHGNLVNDVHLQTLEPGGPDDAKGIVDFVTGPVATKTFSREIGEEINNPAAGGLVTGLFFLRPPPDGVGMRCASTDVYSYMEVSVSFFRVTITPKDRFGRLVRQPQAQNRACGPFTLPYRP